MYDLAKVVFAAAVIGPIVLPGQFTATGVIYGLIFVAGLIAFGLLLRAEEERKDEQ
ncbi:MAG: hypothetical protein ACR2RB_09690 [Gammaproteobacteria bacterium]